MAKYPFRLGTTSYIFPADLVANAARLARWVDDMELVLFDVDGSSNLPDAATVHRLAAIGAAHDLTYTVHLPFDLLPTYTGEHHPIVEKTRRIIEMTHELNPAGYVVHLDARTPTAQGTVAAWAKWRAGCARALEPLIAAVDDPALLCVENLESYPQEIMLETMAQLPVSLCLDVGHLWLEGVNVLDSLRRYLPRTRIVHLHGINGRDHESLVHVAPRELYGVLDEIARQGFREVLTLEVFSQGDFETSLELVKKWTKSLF